MAPISPATRKGKNPQKFITSIKKARMPITLRDLLNDGKVHVLDGAMGTMLYSKGFFLNVCYDELSVKQPKLVQEVHEAYVRAGAEILETNTFGANPVKLGSYGLADDTERINQAAGELARRAAAGRASAAVAGVGVDDQFTALDAAMQVLGED